jgi:acetyltransferase-like isoleucine patch superfamily enzyme
VKNFFRKIANKLSSIRPQDRPQWKFLRADPSCNIYISNSAKVSCNGDGLLELGINSQLQLHENSSVEISSRFVFGRGCTVIVHKNGKLVLGNDSWALHDCWLEVGPGQTIDIGDRVTIQLRCSIHGSVSIGEDVLMAPDVFISSGGHIFDKDNSLTIREQDKLYHVTRSVVIERNSWLGIRSWIAPGVHLSEGTVTGANSVITKNTEKYSVYAGVPAVKIRSYR